MTGLQVILFRVGLGLKLHFKTEWLMYCYGNKLMFTYFLVFLFFAMTCLWYQLLDHHSLLHDKIQLGFALRSTKI